MDLGKILSFISPAYGLASGQGLGKALPYLSPALGAIMGKGLFDHHGGGDEQQAQMPVPGAMGGQNPMQQQGQQQNFGQMPTGMFGSPGQNNPMLNQWLMMNRGGY